MAFLLAWGVALLCAAPCQAQDSRRQPAPDPFFQHKGDTKRSYTITDLGVPSTYRVYVPERWQAGMHLPLVVWLHGGGLTEHYPFDEAPEHLQGILKREAGRRGFIVVAPRGLRGGYGSFYLLPEGFNCQSAGGCLRKPSEAADDFSEQDVLTVIERTAAEYNVDRRRIYLMGHSMGAVGTLHLTKKYPRMFCAIAPSAIRIEAKTYPFDEVAYLSGVIVSLGGKDTAAPAALNKAFVAGFRNAGIETEYLTPSEGRHESTLFYALPQIFEFFDRHKCSS